MTQMNAKNIGIYVAEEQELYRQIYKTSFEMDSSFRFIGIAPVGDKQEMFKVMSTEKPDVLLLGTKKIDVQTFEDIEKICDGYPSTGLVILLTSVDDSDSLILRKIVQKRRNGIAIYLKQSLDHLKQLHDIIISVSRSQVIFDPKVADSLMREKVISPFMKLLTDREMEILNLLSTGYTNQGIAKTLCIDVKTVAHHLNNIYSKLKEDENLDLKHPRVSVARLYLETTGELAPFKSKTPQFSS
jgi:DNA-binding NarL/FixJ family response regulator